MNVGNPTVRAKTARRGASIVESSVVISAALLFLFGIVEYGRFVLIRNLMDDAAREGARLAVVHTTNMTTANIQSQVSSILGNMNSQLKNLNIQVYASDSSGNNIGAWTGAQFGQYIAVQIDGDYSPVLPSFLFMNQTIHMRAKSVMYSEGG